MTLMRLLARFRRLTRHQADLIDRQAARLDELNADLDRVHLHYTREMQGIVSAWLIALERPEVDLRHDLAEFERALGNRIASLEEHVL